GLVRLREGEPHAVGARRLHDAREAVAVATGPEEDERLPRHRPTRSVERRRAVEPDFEAIAGARRGGDAAARRAVLAARRRRVVAGVEIGDYGAPPGHAGAGAPQ